MWLPSPANLVNAKVDERLFLQNHKVESNSKRHSALTSDLYTHALTPHPYTPASCMSGPGMGRVNLRSSGLNEMLRRNKQRHV